MGARLIVMTVVACVTTILCAAEPVSAFKPEARILFIGDSITDGGRGRGTDQNHILGHSYVFLIAAKYGAAFPELNLDFVNRGISGDSVLELEKRWKSDVLDLHPDVLSVMVGANEEIKDISVKLYEKTYDTLLTDAKNANPDLKIVLISPFWGRELNERMTERQKTVEYLAHKHRAALIKGQEIFNLAAQKTAIQYWIWDTVHPTYSGHQLLADEWAKIVGSFWRN